jgi:hypothetical protein
MNIESQTGEEFPVKLFKLESMVENPSIVMIAKRGSGKSWITKAILFKYVDIPVGIIISQSEKDNPFFSDFFPDTFIFYKYESNVMKKLLMRQKLILKKYREKKEQGKKIDPRTIVVMDDCLASKGDWAKDGPILDLLFNGRHRHITYILTMQFPLGISPELRVNFDYVFLLADDTTSNLKRIYEHYAGMFPDLNTFKQIFKQLTQDFGAMVISNRGSRYNIFDKVFFYKAPNLKDKTTKFGCDQFRKFDLENYDPEWEEKMDDLAIDYDEMLLDKKKSKEKINIKKIK